MKLLSLFLFLLSPSLGLAGTAGSGGGGDTLICRDEPNVSPFVGYFSLDYLATYRKANQNADIVKIESWEKSAERIIRNLKRLKANNLLGTFLRFSRNIGNEDDYSDGLIWKESGFGLEDIKDEKLLNKLPTNCIPEKNRHQFIQTVYWKDYNNLRVYNFDYDVIEKLKAQSPVQLSFLYVHEWLWTHFMTTAPIRVLNRLIHSKKFDTMSSEEFLQILSAMKPSYYANVQAGSFVGPKGNIIGFRFSDDFMGKIGTLLFHYIEGYEFPGSNHWFECDFDADGVYNHCQAYTSHRSNNSDHPKIEDLTLRVINFRTIGVLRDGLAEEIYEFSADLGETRQ